MIVEKLDICSLQSYPAYEQVTAGDSFFICHIQGNHILDCPNWDSFWSGINAKLDTTTGGLNWDNSRAHQDIRSPTLHRYFKERSMIRSHLQS